MAILADDLGGEAMTMQETEVRILGVSRNEYADRSALNLTITALIKESAMNSNFEIFVAQAGSGAPLIRV
jgi:hypothetical protein